jgi:phosphoribosylaminoimidazolecarboxamide formyltransferase/IMP cyclohydrolase
MSPNNEIGLVKIRRALISVSDKSGILPFARQLKDLDVEIISTGGSAKLLRNAGIEVRDVSELTGWPEMMDGRVKTLHPSIHGGILAIRDNAEHEAAMKSRGIEPIDLVVVNLYPFEDTVRRAGVSLDQAIEQIDIGGPAMIRSAAKNYKDVAVVTDPAEYEALGEKLLRNAGELTLEDRFNLARKAFQRTASYDGHVFDYLTSQYQQESEPGSEEIFGETQTLGLRKITDLRYGENPHQQAALYDIGFRDDLGVAHAQLLNGKEMSFNNYVDADAAWQLVTDFEEVACAIIKHTNPAGAALGASTEQAYRRALATDPVSAFGGIVAFNRKVDEPTARVLCEIFTEVVLAPDYETGALELLCAKKNLRVLRTSTVLPARNIEYKQITGGMLAQTADHHRLNRADLNVVTKRVPTDDEWKDLFFAWTVCKHTKSNAIVYARDEQTVGVGAGQMSRVDSVRIGAMRAQLPLTGSVLASDAFFPFRDGVDEAGSHGISAVIQPGGSVRDGEVIASADELGLAMVFTGVRHFKH